MDLAGRRDTSHAAKVNDPKDASTPKVQVRPSSPGTSAAITLVALPLLLSNGITHEEPHTGTQYCRRVTIEGPHRMNVNRVVTGHCVSAIDQAVSIAGHHRNTTCAMRLTRTLMGGAFTLYELQDLEVSLRSGSKPTPKCFAWQGQKRRCRP